MAFRYDFLISDLLFRIESSKQLQIPDDFQPFHTAYDPKRYPDISLEIVFATAHVTSGADVRWLSASILQKNCQIMEVFHRKDRMDIIRSEPAGRGQPCRLFIPPDFAEIFCTRGRWLNYFAMERMLLPFDRILLHASAVIYQGKAYLFSAPSGGGKSTHAALWQQYYGAKLLNGDKVIVDVTPNGCRAYGGPIAGSSEVYCNDSAPVGAVIFLHKQRYNQIAPVSERAGILSLYGEAIKSGWDSAYNARLLELIEILQGCVPVLSLECLPEKSAVTCVLRYIGENQL